MRDHLVISLATGLVTLLISLMVMVVFQVVLWVIGPLWLASAFVGSLIVTIAVYLVEKITTT